MKINALRSMKTWPRLARLSGYQFTQKTISKMSNSITGRIAAIGESESIPTKSGSPFLKRQLVIETEDRYPQLIPFEFVQAHVDVPASHKVGELVEVFFDLQGRKWDEKYYVSARGWKIAAVGAQPAPQPPAPTVTVETGYSVAGLPVTAEANIGAAGESDSLPF
jgi:hypothetical protein